MTKASDNAFPSILITEGTEPSAPAAGKQRLYIDSTTHKLKRTDSSGTDVTVEGGLADQGVVTYLDFTTAAAPSSPAAGKIRVYSKTGDHLAQKDSSGTETLLDSAAGSSTNGNGLVAFAPLWSDPVATTGTWTSILFTDVGTPLNNAPAFYNSSAAQNDALSWDIWLDAGTYTFSAWVRKTSNTAIITLNQGGVSQGTVDTYAASPALALVSITGWTVSATGKVTMQVKAATKNASSSGYLLEFFQVIFRRTA